MLCAVYFMAYLKGTRVQVKTEDLKKIIGNKIQYLRDVDIDVTGRGFYFPRYGIITGVFRRQIEINNGSDYIPFKSITEIVLVEE